MIPQPTQQAAANSVHTADLICRLDFASFVRRCFHTLSPSAEFLPNWHIDALAYDLEQVRLGGVTRLIVNLPPRSLKSVIASVAFPAFVLGHDPSKRVIVVSHSADLVIKLANEFRMILNTPWYRRVFPATFISRGKNTELEVVTTRNGSRLAVSIGGALTGRGADFIIVDDALKAMDALSNSKREKRVNELFNNTVLTRLDNKRTGAIVVVGQRLHEKDLPGMLQRSGVPWKTLSFPAIAVRDERVQTGKHSYHLRHAGDALHPEREPLETLEAIRAQIGPYFFAAQYQQAPTPSDHTMIQRAWIHRYDPLPQRTYEFAGYPELGHRGEGGRDERLLGLRDTAVPSGKGLSRSHAAGAVGLSGLERTRYRARSQVSSGRSVGGGCRNRNRPHR